MDVRTTLLVNGVYKIVPWVTILSDSLPSFCFTPTSPGLITAQLENKIASKGESLIVAPDFGR